MVEAQAVLLWRNRHRFSYYSLLEELYRVEAEERALLISEECDEE